MRRYLVVGARVLRQSLEFIPKWLHFRFHRVKIGLPEIFACQGFPFLVNRGEFRVEPGVRINSRFSANPVGIKAFSSFVVRKGGVLILRSGAGFSNSTIVCWNRIEVGSRTQVGADVRIYDTDFHSLDATVRPQEGPLDIQTKPVVLGPDAFVGAGCIVLKGTNLGARSVLGAGSVLAGSVPEDEIWAGNPAKFLRKAPGGL